MRVVADANVFVSAALGRSPSAPSVRIINAALDGRIELVMSPALLREVADVLARPRIRSGVSAEDAQLFLADIAAQVVMFADPADPPNICRDPDDDYLVALATVCGADALVSGDDDLLAVDSPTGVDVDVGTDRPARLTANRQTGDRHAASGARRNPTARGSASRISIACCLIVSSNNNVSPRSSYLTVRPVVAAFLMRSRAFSSPHM